MQSLLGDKLNNSVVIQDTHTIAIHLELCIMKYIFSSVNNNPKQASKQAHTVLYFIVHYS